MEEEEGKARGRIVEAILNNRTIPSHLKLALCALANGYDCKSKYVEMKASELASKTGVTLRTAQRNINELIVRRLITNVSDNSRSGDGTFATNRYSLELEVTSEITEVKIDFMRRAMHELSGNEYKVLLAAILNSDPVTNLCVCTMTALGDASGISRARVGGMLRKLDSLGFLSYRPGSNQFESSIIDTSAAKGEEPVAPIQTQRINTALRQTVYERDDYVCHICGEPVDMDAHHLNEWAPTVDHIIPRSHGGCDDVDNLKTAHRWCNTVRSNRTVEHAKQMLGCEL